jgi:hypothetical protein
MAEDLAGPFRSFYEQAAKVFNSRDLDDAVRWLPDDFELHPVGQNPELRVRRGPAEIAAFFGEFHEVFDDWRVEPLEFGQVGEHAVLVHHVLRGRSRSAGVPVEVHTYELWEGRSVNAETSDAWKAVGMHPVRVRQFLSHEEALAAAEG